VDEGERPRAGNDSASLNSLERFCRHAWRYIFQSRSTHLGARERSPYSWPSFFRQRKGATRPEVTGKSPRGEGPDSGRRLARLDYSAGIGSSVRPSAAR
jgi:hypothetical protein